MFKSKANFTENPATSTTIIGAGTSVTGDLESNGDIRIDGCLKGNILGCSKVLIGPEGSVEGNIFGTDANILGRVSGKVSVKDLLQLRGKALVTGDIFAGKLQVEPTASFNGSCQMGASVVELKVEINNAAVNQ